MTALLVALTIACTEQGVNPADIDNGGSQVEHINTSLPGVNSLNKGVRNFRTHLSGANQVPDPRPTRAQGEAIFQLSKDGTELTYKLIVANIENVFMAHIHIAPATANGPITVWLYPQVPFQPSPTTPPASWIEGRFDGVLASDTITAANLSGPLAGKTLADLIMEIESGNAYVNVHTNDFVAPLNTGAGDFFPGEIRGQIF
jgi:hypothetical protein